MSSDSFRTFEPVGPEFKAALEAHPPEGSAERVWGKVSQQVDVISGQKGVAGPLGGSGGTGGSGGSGGKPSDSKIVVLVAAAAALILLVGLGVAALLGSAGSTTDSESDLLVGANIERLASAEKKLDEADEAVGHGEFGTADELIDGYSSDIEEVEAAAEGDEQVAKALDEAMPRLEEKFKALEVKVPEAARKRGIARAREVHARNAARKAARAQGKQNKGSDNGDDNGRPAGKGPGGAKGKGGKGGKGHDGDGGSGSSGSSGSGSGSGGSGGSGDSGDGGESGGSGTFDPAG